MPETEASFLIRHLTLPPRESLVIMTGLKVKNFENWKKKQKGLKFTHSVSKCSFYVNDWNCLSVHEVQLTRLLNLERVWAKKISVDFHATFRKLNWCSGFIGWFRRTAVAGTSSMIDDVDNDEGLIHPSKATGDRLSAVPATTSTVGAGLGDSSRASTPSQSSSCIAQRRIAMTTAGGGSSCSSRCLLAKVIPFCVPRASAVFYILCFICTCSIVQSFLHLIVSCRWCYTRTNLHKNTNI